MSKIYFEYGIEKIMCSRIAEKYVYQNYGSPFVGQVALRLKAGEPVSIMGCDNYGHPGTNCKLNNKPCTFAEGWKSLEGEVENDK